MRQLLPPAVLLLLASASTGAEGVQKAVVSLHPEWDRLLERDNVTLRCRGAQAEGNGATRWWHNGHLLPNRTSSYFVESASVSDSGEYRCQTSLSNLSDPVQLQVRAAWLLLQAPRWKLREGDPLVLRCHSWKNKQVYNVQYFQGGRGRQFSYNNTPFRVPRASRKHNGSYFCRGLIGKLNVSSEAVVVLVEALAISSSGHLVLLCLLPGLLFAVDTGLYFSVRRGLRSLLRNRTTDNITWSKSLQDKQEQ
ncbi:low affinity immunoglobulin gamma Fc region receptor III-A-like [Myotis daubentonii]|uniref:low affinity immunoglobulin gamma Fc region receptor III-A-like n=1 Tax=Myotis daubentonii TaxID=98922 RepID=UPI002873EBFD|nr:low affinity immunoglobulin gamma Fc region receptor III-A-like [Myotis daubentonii]